MVNKPNPNQVNDALLLIQDLLDRAPLEFILLKETAKQVIENHHGLLPELDLECIDIGIQQKNFTRDGASMFKTLLDLNKVDYDWKPEEIRMLHNGVPINIKVFKRKYGFFQNPNRCFYRTVEMWVPNPFDKYYKARFIVR